MPSTDPPTDPSPSPLARLTFETGGGDHLTIANLVNDLHRLVFLPGDLFIWALTTCAAPFARLARRRPERLRRCAVGLRLDLRMGRHIRCNRDHNSNNCRFRSARDERDATFVRDGRTASANRSHSGAPAPFRGG